MTLTLSEQIDPARWPDVAVVPDDPVRARIAEQLVRQAVRTMPIRLVTADGRRLGAGRPGDPELRLVRPQHFYRRLAAGGLIGFGESYMAGDWTSEDLAGVLTVLASRVRTLIPPALQRLRSAVLHARPAWQDNTIAGARQNIQAHYDLSNELFELFLDPSLTYSCALFEADPAAGSEPLQAAQHRKIDRLLDVAGVQAGSSLVEIGTGWGELAIRAARRGAQVTTVTISTEQAELATKRIAEAGLTERVEVRLQDYRDLTGSYDALVSVEMIEAVGANHWDEYFAAIRRLLRPAGRAARAGHHHAARPDAGDHGHLHLDGEVHLSRRPSALGAGCSGVRGPGRADRRHRAGLRPALRRDPAPLAGGVRGQRRAGGGAVRAVRSGLPANVDALSSLLRSGIPVPVSRRGAVRPDRPGQPASG